MKIILFDTETTGLLLPEPADLKKQPYIIELYAVAIDENFTLLEEFETFVKPPFDTLPDEITKITKITSNMIKNQPSFLDIYPQLAKMFTGTDILIAHNLMFDKNMLKNELDRIGKVTEFPWPRHNICTVEKTMHINGYRLNMQRFHYEMTGVGFSDAHRAEVDVHALVRGVHGMVEKELLNFKDYEK